MIAINFVKNKIFFIIISLKSLANSAQLILVLETMYSKNYLNKPKIKFFLSKINFQFSNIFLNKKINSL